MEAQEKIYIQPNAHDGWFEINPNSDIFVQYTRTDAFIEKACDWLESINLDWYQIREGVFSRQLVEDFRNYMKGE